MAGRLPRSRQLAELLSRSALRGLSPPTSGTEHLPEGCASQGREPCPSLANPDGAFLDDPELLRYGLRRESGNELLDELEDPRHILIVPVLA
jgi:hypothetical protein